MYRSNQSNLASNKLTRKHIDWKAAPMNVKLAVQTLSNSVAQSIDRLRQSGLKQFEGSEGTSEFIKRCDKLFNVFNSDKIIEGDIFKTPITSNSKQAIFEFLDDMIDYLDGIKVKGQTAMKSSRHTPFRGFKGNHRLK